LKVLRRDVAKALALWGRTCFVRPESLYEFLCVPSFYHVPMKSLLILILISTCIVAWRSDDVVDLIQGASTVKSAVASGIAMQARNQQGSRQTAYQDNQPGATPMPMTLEKFAELSKSDSNAARRFFDRRAQSERTDDKR
jgi:hypothetical protein